jgi:vacuolar-type H+-ATPase subunit H|tara:strand:- start:553 stop:813 length:261 start_codon:yes stop_codon:yes gene_type:complete
MAEAKVEAEKIVSQFKDTQEGTYQQALNAVNSATGDEGNKLMASTNADIAEMQGDFVERKGDVEDMLVNLVTKVEYKPRPARTGTQ